jgi:nitrogen PTS system EIIA component
MNISDFLAPADVLIDFRAADKKQLLQELSRHAAHAKKLDANEISQAIFKREELGSTGVGGGVAIPHARIANLKDAFGVMVRLRKAINFEAVDRQPVDLVFLLLLPKHAEGTHLNALAAIARRLRETHRVQALRQAREAASLYHTVTLADHH